MAVYPSISDIKSSIESEVLIKDTFVKSGEFKRLPNGNFTMYVGGFSVVFPFSKSNENWVFRCWHTDLGDIKKRYEKFSVAIKNSKLPYFADFEYEDVGIIVNGKPYPTTRMKWIDGQSIKSYICENRFDKQKLQLLSENFKKMCDDLHTHNLAHGDLQHGNILVSTNGKLFLVDYDSMYCPTLKGEKDIITGLVDYQHPSRIKNRLANEKVDYFSELIIYLSILITKSNPHLINKYQVENSERLFFCKSDFTNLSKSSIIKDLSNSETEIKLYIRVLNDYLSKNSIDDLETFEVVKQHLPLNPIKSFQWKNLFVSTVLKNMILFLSFKFSYVKKIGIIISDKLNKIYSLKSSNLLIRMKNITIKGVYSIYWFLGFFFEGLSVLFLFISFYSFLFLSRLLVVYYGGYNIPLISNFSVIWEVISYNYFFDYVLEIKDILHPYLFISFFVFCFIIFKRISIGLFRLCVRTTNKLILDIVGSKKFFIYSGITFLLLFISISLLQGQTMNLAVFDTSMILIAISIFLNNLKSHV